MKVKIKKMHEKEMSLNEYQSKAMTTCMPSSENFSYMFLNLIGEVGEFASKVAKQIRKSNMNIEDSQLAFTTKADINNLDCFYEELQKEAGDILWQLSGLCTVMGWSLEDIAQINLDKLASRKAMGTIDGNGDGIIRGK